MRKLEVKTLKLALDKLNKMNGYELVYRPLQQVLEDPSMSKELKGRAIDKACENVNTPIREVMDLLKAIIEDNE